MALTPKQQRFVGEYLVDLNATQAAIRAGYSARTAGKIGSENLSKPEIAAAVSAAQDERAKRTGITADRVLQELALIAFGDARRLVEHRRTACRHCYGKGFLRQRTKAELDRDRQAHERMVRRHKARVAADDDYEGDPPGPFDEEGGVGWDPRKDPHPDCPECLGEGRGRTIIRDTRRLDDAARALYLGVKETKDGFEVKTASKEHALELLGKHLKLFTDKLEVSGDGIAERLARARERLKGGRS